MAETVFRGPAYSAGSMLDGRIESASDGPGLEYQANCFPDVRWTPTRKDGEGPGRVPAFLNSPFVVTVDTIPSSTATASIAALANVTNGTPLTMTTVAPGGSAQNVPSLSPGMPLVPFQKSASAAVTVLGLDFGFTTGNITAGSGSVANISDPTIFQPGQWVCIGGAGNAAKTASLFTQVTAIGTTTITVSPVPLGTLTAAPIASTNLPSGAFTQPQSYPPGFFAVPTSPDPYLSAGLARIFNPNEGIGRNIQITGVASGTGGVFIVRGWDTYGVPMSENITVGAGANTVAGKKAFKYLATGTTNATGGIVPQFTDAHNYSAGPGNVVGINLRSLFWEYMNIFYNGGFAVTNAGWTAADQTNPATATTGDVRGTINASTLATIGAALDGTKRMTLAMTIRLIDNISGTPLNTIPLFGVPQFTQ
jgi:hypothetical protein